TRAPTRWAPCSGWRRQPARPARPARPAGRDHRPDRGPGGGPLSRRPRAPPRPPGARHAPPPGPPRPPRPGARWPPPRGPPGGRSLGGRSVAVTGPPASVTESSPLRLTGRGIGRAAALIGGITVVARVVGFGRQLVFAHTVGSHCLGTAYATANQVPNIIYDCVRGGALTPGIVRVRAGAAAHGAQSRRVERSAAGNGSPGSGSGTAGAGMAPGAGPRMGAGPRLSADPRLSA